MSLTDPTVTIHVNGFDFVAFPNDRVHVVTDSLGTADLGPYELPGDVEEHECLWGEAESIGGGRFIRCCVSPELCNKSMVGTDVEVGRGKRAATALPLAPSCLRRDAEYLEARAQAIGIAESRMGQPFDAESYRRAVELERLLTSEIEPVAPVSVSVPVSTRGRALAIA
jgi:hypothetical protein